MVRYVASERRFLKAALLALVWSALLGGCRGQDGEQPPGGGEPQASCADPQWRADGGYAIGDTVQNLGQRYECTGHPGWCNQVSYEPDGKNPFWESTWTHLGACSSPEPEHNKITLVFPDNVEYGDQALTGALAGSLQCGSDIRPFSANAGDTIVIDELGKCDYVLILAGSERGLPMDTGRVLPLTEDRGQNLHFSPRYRRVPDIQSLLALPGAKVRRFAVGLDQPRQMALGGNGRVLYVGSSAIPHWADIPLEGTVRRRANAIYALELNEQQTLALKTYVIATGIEEPHGLAWRDGTLYFSTSGSIMRIDDVDARYREGVLPATQVAVLPADGEQFPLPHIASWRWYHQKHPLYFNPLDPSDPHLYTAVGIPCNVCIAPDPGYGTVMRFDPESGKGEVLAKGVRNAGGLDWNPSTGSLWFGDNNRDGFDNDDELNIIKRGDASRHFGAPYVFGRDTLGILQEEWDRRDNLAELRIPQGAILSDLAPAQIRPADYTPPAYVFGSNYAPLGLRFWEGYGPAVEGRTRLLTAVHSAGKNDRPGMGVMMLTLDGDTVESSIPLVTGWRTDDETNPVGCLQQGGCLGSPVEFLPMPDGSLLVSDDVAGVIYQVSYSSDGLPSTRIQISAPEPPDAALQGRSAIGVLIDPQGRRRDLEVSLGKALSLPGFAFGDYRIEWKNMGEWVPRERVMAFSLSAENPEPHLNLELVPRPELSVKLTLNAPPRPVGAAADRWQVSLTNDQDQVQTLNVTWGSQHVVPLSYGDYVLTYPYTEKAYPSPQLQRFTVDAESMDMTYTTAYTAVEDLGKQVIDTGNPGCVGCHAPAMWRSPSMAEKWGAGDVDSLMRKISGMNVNMRNKDEHCDDVCAREAARYLRDVVWEPYLGVSGAFGPRQVRLLSRSEYINSIRDVLGVEVAVDSVPQDKAGVDFFYPAEARAGVLSAEDTRRYYDLAVQTAQQVDLSRLQQRFGSSAAQSIPALGRMLFRRPLSEAEVQRYQAVLGSAGAGMADVVAAMLVSPKYLYRSELGVAQQDGVFALTPMERATTLSYTLLGTTPDDALLSLAESGGLDSPQQLETVALSLLQDPRSVEQLATFFSHYVGTPQSAPVSPRPGLDADVIDAMRAEQRALVSEVMTHGSGTIDELFNPAYTFLNQPLATHYGISGVSGNSMVKKPLDEAQRGQRGGLLNSGLFAVTFANDTTTSVILRGYQMRRHLFCQAFPANALRPEPLSFPDKPLTTREYWDVWTGPEASEGTCWTCHQFFNDAGAIFENYDAAGRFRLTEKAVNEPYVGQDVAINSVAPLISPAGDSWIERAQGVRDISRHVPQNRDALTCMAEGYYRYAIGQRAADGEGYKTVIQMRDELAAAGGDVRKMIVRLMLSGALNERKNLESRR